ncbi:MAG TPA: type I DNA topoisomerase [Geminicoccaceae bacterium]|nr:type I DNA topoisomerase [Geminicoccaceae bacterium]
MDVVVVESPTKAKTIRKYLADAPDVEASYGHVRDLPSQDGAVLPDDDFRMVWEVLPGRKKNVDEIVRAVKKARRLFLATDPDREGEAISWHLLEVLKERGALKGIEVKRVVFHEITKRAVTEAMAHPRDLDQSLIDAYLARRALDYLVGFTLSPVLWRKLQGSRSAGRVQSVALRLICEREAEIEAFTAREYWTIEALLETPDQTRFKARLTHLAGKKLDKFALGDKVAAEAALAKVQAATLAIGPVEKKQVSRNPSPPFSTSTLQQEAARKLGFSADRTMKTAQRLFEGTEIGGETVGLITYMRTDSVQLSRDAISAARKRIAQSFGDAYLPEQPRIFKTKTKNAQEAHEAIRPTDVGREPKTVARFLDNDQSRLYELIWKRTMASQMAAARLDRVTVDVLDEKGAVQLRATGQTIAFDGFLKLYQEGRDDPLGDDEDGEGVLLPALVTGTKVAERGVTPEQHFTEPPPRFSEASLVKRLEELGVGRPSTYASIISVLQDRDYVRLEQKRFVPEDRGRLVTAFLTSFFDRYVQPTFTAALEDQLDRVAAGELGWKDVLRAFWEPFVGSIGEVSELRVAQVIDALNEALSAKLFPPRTDGGDPRICPLCGNGQLSLKLGRYGAFIGCSNHPECRYTRKLDDDPNGDPAARNDEKLLGVDPLTEEEVWLKNGRFGFYLQSGSGDALRRSSLPPNLTPTEIDLQTALALLALPRIVGTHPETGAEITAGINRYGPFVQHQGKFVRLEADDDVLSLGMNRALTLIAEGGSRGRQRAAAAPLRELGAHPDTGEKVVILDGRFGPYVKHGKTNASLPKGRPVEELTMDEAVALLAAREAKGGSKGKGRTTSRKAPAKAKPAKATAVKKKPAARKPAARKKSAAGGGS